MAGASQLTIINRKEYLTWEGMLNVTDNFEVAKRTSKGQMTLPVRAREKLGQKRVTIWQYMR